MVLLCHKKVIFFDDLVLVWSLPTYPLPLLLCGVLLHFFFLKATEQKIVSSYQKKKKQKKLFSLLFFVSRIACSAVPQFAAER